MKNIIYQVGKPTSNFPLWHSNPYYLTIEGGSGHGKEGEGGTYKFTGAYLHPDQERHRVIFVNRRSCLSSFCKRAGIKFWHANSIEELLQQMKDLSTEDITLLTSNEWISFEKCEKENHRKNLERDLESAKSYIEEIPKRKRAIRKDGNLRSDLQKEIDNHRFRKEKAERALKIYKPNIV